jgi:deoxyhypusine synthase
MEHEIALNAVLKSSSEPATVSNDKKTSKDQITMDTLIRGHDFNQGTDFDSLFDSFIRTGFQASALGLAAEQIRMMLHERRSGSFEEDEQEGDEFVRRRSGCTIFLSYTSNLVSSGVREHIRYLVQHRLVDCVVTTAGGVEEDIIKCLAPTFLGDFAMSGAQLRSQGINRIGNLLVPNDNYCAFEQWLMPLLDELLEQQKQNPDCIWSPSTIIQKLGERIDNPESICYWAARNHIPIFCPALTDGSLGDMIFFHSYRNPGLIVDIARDIRRINRMALKASKSGVVVLGGGLVKHHVCNANLMRNGADYAVFINTASEFDGSDAGARPDEAVSWGKIRTDARPVKVQCDASIAFPLLVSQTFAKHVQQYGDGLSHANPTDNRP